MFKPAEMQKIRVTGLRSDLERVIKALHEMGEVDFRKVKDGYFEADAPLEHFAEISEQLVRMRGIEAMLVPQKVVKQKVGDWQQVVGECKSIQIDAVLRGIITRRDELKRRKAELTARVAVLRQLAPLDVDFDSVRGGLLGAVAGTMQAARLEEMKKGVEKVTKHFDYKAVEVSKGRSVVLVAYEKAAEQKVKDSLAAAGFAEIAIEGIHGRPTGALREAKLGLHDVDINTERLDEELTRISKEKWSHIVALREALEIEEQRCVVTRKFGRSAKLFSLEGWIVKNHFAKVESALASVTGKKIDIETISTGLYGAHGHGGHGAQVAQEDVPPTLLENPEPMGPFENLVKFISVPASNELDPTPIFSFTFAIIYGMMLGDVGSGIISALLAWWLMKKFKNPLMQTVCKAWIIGSISAIIFGIAYDEWFGFSHAFLLGLPPDVVVYHGMHRLTNTTLLLGLVILVGAAHILLGFLLGFINAWRHKDMRHAAAKLGWMGVEISGIALVMTYLFNMFSPDVGMAAAVIFGISLIPIVRAEGPLGLVEIPSLAGNILSYARVMAVGLAGVVVVEEIINKMVLPDPSTGMMFFVILPIFIVLQILHVIIDMFEALVQGARLNLIEFFSKFYKGGGVPFEPFKVERMYSEEGRVNVREP